MARPTMATSLASRCATQATGYPSLFGVVREKPATPTYWEIVEPGDIEPRRWV